MGRRTHTVILAIFLAQAGSHAWSSQARKLTFEERVQVQETIERIYYSHQIGRTLSFEEAVPRSVIEGRVQAYLKQSAALEEFWSTPVSAPALERELARIAAGTRLPERLSEIYAALGNDPFLIQECFARPVLVDRLSRSFFQHDQRIHGQARESALRLREQLMAGELEIPQALPPLAQQIVPSSDKHRMRLENPIANYETIPDIREEPHAFIITVPGAGLDGESADYVVEKISWERWWAENESRWIVTSASGVATGQELPLPSQAGSVTMESCFEGFWDNRSMDNPPPGLALHDAIWTGSLMIMWGGGRGQRYDPLTDVFSIPSPLNAPSIFARGRLVWTGNEMIVWGSDELITGSTVLGTAYDPVQDVWRPLSKVNAPSLRIEHSSVWTGREMIVWGGQGPDLRMLKTGGRYDPTTDTWKSMTTVNAPMERSRHGAIWTGQFMVVWGATDIDLPIAGGRYDPGSDKWFPMSMLGAPASRVNPPVVWTGHEMMFWGGRYGGIVLDTGGRYDPVDDLWRPMSRIDQPALTGEARAVWTGSEYFVWGGGSASSGLYDPVNDRWRRASAVNAPSSRSSYSVAWTGELAIVWGGFSNGETLNTGARYHAGTDTWTPTFSTPPRAKRIRSTAVWTGNHMILWGGTLPLTPSGDRYDPLTDNWTEISQIGAPFGRLDHSAIWSGRWMIVWGGGTSVPTKTGGRYDPVSDSWLPTTTVNAPSERGFHSAIWTGTEMIVWGGLGGSSPLSTGGRYEPALDRWLPIASQGAPSISLGNTTVWTGSEMIVWGGREGFNGGSAFNLSTDSWRELTRNQAPIGRSGHTAVWTGREMIVWGGAISSARLADGAAYDPATNSWRTISPIGAPEGRALHTAVWTGGLMIVWGGERRVGADFFSSGGQYDPLTDTWAETPLEGAPAGRSHHTAVWTGNEMIIYGAGSSTGGRFVGAPHPDQDGDGAYLCQGDCDDANPSSYPGAPEICDRLDNDCDRSIDESFSIGSTCEGVGICGAGIVECASQLVTRCSTEPGGSSDQSQPETCDGLDNDCDGAADEELGLTTCGVGGCASTVDNCVGGVPQACVPGTPTAETCNGLDDDCDGAADEELGLTTCGVGGCANTVDNCVGGVPQACVPGTPTAETCDGGDNDCDGTTDEGLGPGTVEVSLDPIRLWPPNHRMVDIHSTVALSGGCPAACPTPPTTVLRSAISSEADDVNGAGDGHTVDDIQNASIGAADFDLKMRAERDGNRNGRLYEVAYAVTDCFGDTAVGYSGVVVPHDEGGQTEPLILDVVAQSSGGTGSYALEWRPIAAATSYNVVRARMSSIRTVGSFTIIDDARCLTRGLTTTSLSGGSFEENPAPGETFFYLAEYVKGAPSGYGGETGGRELVIGSGDACH